MKIKLATTPKNNTKKAREAVKKALEALKSAKPGNYIVIPDKTANNDSVRYFVRTIGKRSFAKFTFSTERTKTGTRIDRLE